MLSRKLKKGMVIVTGKGLQYLKVFWEGLFEKVVSEQRFEENKGASHVDGCSRGEF